VAGLGKDLVNEIKNRAPDLDLSLRPILRHIVNLPRHLHEAGWTGPYAVTEWGATGHWNVARPVGPRRLKIIVQ